MKLTGNTEWAVLGALIAYVAFTPGFPAVRQLLATGLGKALGLALVVYVWKYVSEPVALLLVVVFLHCSSMREGMKNPNAHCPTGFMLTDDNKCKDAMGKEGPDPIICPTGQTFNSTSNACEAPASMTPTSASATASTTATPSMPPTASPAKEGFLPNEGGANNYASV